MIRLVKRWLSTSAVAMIVGLFFVRLANAGNPVGGLPLTWPVPSVPSTLSQDYAQYNSLGNSLYHAGLDIPAPGGGVTRVVAAGAGTVRRLDMTGNSADGFNGDNHCMGNVVIINHGSAYTLYAHLFSITVANGASVFAGQQIGTVGQTPTVARPGCTPPTGPHLHFELKNGNFLGDVGDHGNHWGYTVNLPDSTGYHDPLLNIATAAVTGLTGTLVQVTSLGNQANLRTGPGVYTVTGVQVATSQQYTAVNSAAATSNCPRGWYNVRKVDGGLIGSAYAEAWVCRGDASGDWVLPLVSDKIPDAFSFTSQTGVALNTTVTSTPSITVSGINAAASISVTGGSYSVNGGVFTTAAGTLNNGNTVAVRLTSSGSYSTQTCTTLNIGGVQGQFCATTQAPAVDTIPNAFSFTSQTGVALNTTVTSTPSITVSGINAAAPISITGGSYSINGAAFTTAAGTLNNGNTVAVRLTSSGSYSTQTCTTLNIGGGQGQFCATTQAGAAVTNTKASITSPTPGSKLAGASVTFAWNAGSGVSQYWLYVGTSTGANDLYGQSQGTNRSVTVTGQPTDGRNLYVRLWSLISGSWQFNDYTYTAAGTAVTNTKASITSPTPSSKLAGASVTFAWNAGSGVSQYWFYVGTSAGGNDLYGQSQGTNRSATVSGLPTDGRNLYVRLWSLISGTWQFNDYTYTAAGIKLIVFPIPNRIYSTVSINSVFDHSMNTPYCSDNIVVAYTGEEGRIIYGSKLVGNINGCGNLYGFKNGNATVFSVGGQYTGAGTPQYLSYDGHPGYDYRTTDQCPGDLRVTTDCPTGILGQIRIRAAADGRVSTIVPSYGRIQIDHGDGYETWYMHLSKIDVAVGQSVMAGDYIGISGDTGSTGSPHLHFEVRLNGIPVDPYGWQGSGVDPYTLDENIWLW